MIYSMTTAFQLITGEFFFFFLLALAFSKSITMIPVVWHQRKKLIMQDFSESLGRLQLWLLQAQACFSFQCGNTAIACTKCPHWPFGGTLTGGRMLLRCTIAALSHKWCTTLMEILLLKMLPDGIMLWQKILNTHPSPRGDHCLLLTQRQSLRHCFQGLMQKTLYPSGCDLLSK